MALKVRREVLRRRDRASARELLAPTSTHALDRHRRLAAAEQGDRGPQRLRPRGGHPPARHARQPALLRDHDPGERRRLASRMLVLGKHSGRHAVESRLKQLGVALKAGGGRGRSPREVKELADRKKFVYDEDLLALVEHAAEPRARLVRYQVARRATRSCPRRRSRWRWTGHRRTASAVGNGPLDAALKAADAALGFELSCSRCTPAR